MINRFKKYYNIDNSDVTTSGPSSPVCTSFHIAALTKKPITFTYTNCLGEISSITVPAYTGTLICAYDIDFPPNVSDSWSISIEDPCL